MDHLDLLALGCLALSVVAFWAGYWLGGRYGTNLSEVPMPNHPDETPERADRAPAAPFGPHAHRFESEPFALDANTQSYRCLEPGCERVRTVRRPPPPPDEAERERERRAAERDRFLEARRWKGE